LIIEYFLTDVNENPNKIEERREMTYEKVAAYLAKHEGMSIKQFEQMCGIGNGIVGKWRAGVCKPRLESLEKIATATKTSVRSWL